MIYIKKNIRSIPTYRFQFNIRISHNYFFNIAKLSQIEPKLTKIDIHTYPKNKKKSIYTVQFWISQTEPDISKKIQNQYTKTNKKICGIYPNQSKYCQIYPNISKQYSQIDPY